MEETKTITTEVKDCLSDKCITCQDNSCFWFYLTGRMLGKSLKKEIKE